MTSPSSPRPRAAAGAPQAADARPHPDLSSLPGAVDAVRKVAGHDTGAALRLLSEALAGIDPIVAPADPRLIQAAQFYATYLGEDTDRDRHDLQLTWARYAYLSAGQAWGLGSERWQKAAAHYADVLTAQGLPGDAVTVQRRRVAAYEPDRTGPAAFSARRSLAVALHTDGRCGEALDEIRTALHAWRCLPDTQPGQGRPLIHAYLRMAACCDQPEQARTAVADLQDLVGPPGSSDREREVLLAVFDLRRLQLEHRPVCELPLSRSMPPPCAGGDSTAFWLALLCGATPSPDSASAGEQPPLETGR